MRTLISVVALFVLFGADVFGAIGSWPKTTTYTRQFLGATNADAARTALGIVATNSDVLTVTETNSISVTNLVGRIVTSNNIVVGTIGTNLLSQSAYDALVGGGDGGSGDATLAGNNTWTGTNTFNNGLWINAEEAYITDDGSYYSAGLVEVAGSIRTSTGFYGPLLTNEGNALLVNGVPFVNGGMDASNILTGTIDAARLPTTLGNGSYGGVGLTNGVIETSSASQNIKAAGNQLVWVGSTKVLRGTSNGDSDLGSSSVQWKNAYLSGIMAAKGGLIISSNSAASPPTLSPGDVSFMSDAGVPVVVSKDAGGVERTNRLDGVPAGIVTNNHAAAVTFSNDVTVASNLVVQGSSTFDTLNVGELNVTNLAASIIDSTNIINGTISSNDIAAGTIGTNLLSQSAYNALVGGGGSGVTGITTNVAVLVPGDLTNTLQFYLGVLTNVVAGVVTNKPPAFDYDDVQTFESALAGNWSETDADSRLSVADNAAKKNGTNGMSYAAAVTNEAYLKWDDASANDDVSVGFWFKSGEFENYAGLRRIVQFWNDGQGNVGYIAEGRNAGDNARQLLWSIGSGVVTIADNTWYYVTAQYTRNGTSQLAVYDEELEQVGSTVNGTAPDFAVDEIQWKAADIASSTAVFWDDIYIDVTDATFPLGPQ